MRSWLLVQLPRTARRLYCPQSSDPVHTVCVLGCHPPLPTINTSSMEGAPGGLRVCVLGPGTVLGVEWAHRELLGEQLSEIPAELKFCLSTIVE